ncbi:MAG: hypothetical protein KF729_07010 [Sandaracinaceae bacterium]|nr:hypothetical protein [Sandaracinaceae bacterium]
MADRLTPALLALSLCAACNLDQAGIDPRPATMNFPVAVRLYQPDPTIPASHLFVVNSNFDLRFNTGTLHAIDLQRVRDLVAGQCGGGGTDCMLDRLTYVEDPTEGAHPVLSDEVGIGSHASGLELRPGDHGRLYLPSRTSRDLTTIDFAPNVGFTCEQSYRAAVDEGTPRWEAGDVPRCARSRRVTRREGVANERGLELVGDPVAAAVVRSRDIGPVDVGDFLLVALREGRVALFLDDGSAAVPELLHVAEGFPQSLVSLTMEPGRAIGWLTSSTTNELARVGIVVDPGAPARSFVYDAGRLRLGGVDDGQDTRDMVFHPRRSDVAFILSRRPESVIEVDLVRRGLTPSDLGLRGLYEVGRGPSRLATAVLGDRTYVLASCFDAQRLFVFDVEVGALVSVIGGFSGPFELVIDAAEERAYLVDFSISVVRVLDLSPLATGGVPTLIATLGVPTPVVSLTGT